MYTTEDLGGKDKGQAAARDFGRHSTLSAVFLSSTSIHVMSVEPKGKWGEGTREGKSLRLKKSETVLRVASFSAHHTKAVWEAHLLDRSKDYKLFP